MKLRNIAILTSLPLLFSTLACAPRKDFDNTLNGLARVTTASGEQLAIAYQTTYKASFANATDAYDWTVTRHSGKDTRDGAIYNNTGFAHFTEIYAKRLQSAPGGLENETTEAQLREFLEQIEQASIQQFNDQTNYVDVVDVRVINVVSLKQTALDNANNFVQELYGENHGISFSSKGEDTDGDGYITVTYLDQEATQEFGRQIYGYLACNGLQEAGSCEPNREKYQSQFTDQELANRALNIPGNSNTETQIRVGN